MPFRIENLVPTTKLGNNCLLNCLVPAVRKKLLDAAGVSDDMLQRSSVFGVLENFRSFYGIGEGISNQELLRGMNKLLAGNPKDCELILSPILRSYLGELVLRKKDEYYGGVEEDGHYAYGFTHVVRAYLQYENDPQFTGQFKNIIESNKQFLQELHTDYVKFCTEQKSAIGTVEDSSVMLFLTSNLGGSSREEICKDHWMSTGCQLFAKYISQAGSNGVYLAVNDIKPLLEELCISLEAYVGDELEQPSQTIGDPVEALATVKVRLEGGHDHWEREAMAEENVEQYKESFETPTPLMRQCSSAAGNYVVTLQSMVSQMFLTVDQLSADSSSHDGISESSELVASRPSSPAGSSLDPSVTPFQSAPIDGVTSFVAPSPLASRSPSPKEPESRMQDDEVVDDQPSPPLSPSPVVSADYKHFGTSIEEIEKRIFKESTTIEKKKEIFEKLHKQNLPKLQKLVDAASPESTGVQQKRFTQSNYLKEYLANVNNPSASPVSADHSDSAEKIRKQIEEDEVRAKILQEVEIAKYRP